MSKERIYRPFRFKEFSVKHQRSAHKVGIDSILLGCWASFSNPGQIVDIGTGSGLLSLMLLQRFPSANCIAIDVDPIAVEEARSNFEESPWGAQIATLNLSLQRFAETMPDGSYDAIICNPPYFEKSLPNVDRQKRMARHANTLTRKELFTAVRSLLSENGTFCCILPTARIIEDVKLAEALGLYVVHLTNVYADLSKPSKISLVKFVKGHCKSVRDVLVIGIEGKRTKEFRALTQNFYL